MEQSRDAIVQKVWSPLHKAFMFFPVGRYVREQITLSFGRRAKEQGLSRELEGIDLSVLEAVEPEKCTLNADGGDDVLPQQVEWCELHKRISNVCSNATPDLWRRQAMTEKVEAIRARQLAALRALMKAALKSLEPEMRTAFDYLVKVCQGWNAKDASELHQNAQDALQSCGRKIPSSNTLQLCRFFTRSMVEQEYDDMRTAVALFCSHLLELTSCIVCKQSDSDNGRTLQQMGSFGRARSTRLAMYSMMCASESVCCNPVC